MTRYFALFCCAAALIGSAPAGQAFAASLPGSLAAGGVESVTSAWRAQISAREARNIAERAYPRASVLDVRFVDGGRPYYAVRMIEDGRRFDVRVDADTGRIL